MGASAARTKDGPMSFRDNMQHLRATRNMTQEQLAMLLGVSRQSVSKWEAERAYPEMDKLLKMCGLFECTLDELVTGDLTGRPANGAASIPPGKSQQDVTGYDQAMCLLRRFCYTVPRSTATAFHGRLPRSNAGCSDCEGRASAPLGQYGRLCS